VRAGRIENPLSAIHLPPGFAFGKCTGRVSNEASGLRRNGGWLLRYRKLPGVGFPADSAALADFAGSPTLADIGRWRTEVLSRESRSRNDFSAHNGTITQ
jgi:hypothetical protein